MPSVATPHGRCGRLRYAQAAIGCGRRSRSVEGADGRRRDGTGYSVVMNPLSAAAYPHDRKAEIMLRDGSTVHVRPVRTDDRQAMHAFLEGLSPESIGFRFFGMPSLEWATNWSVDVDYADRFALVAETGPSRRIVAHAAYVRQEAARAEVAFVVAERWQGKGISTVLLAHLAEVAEAHGISTFTGQVLPHNHRMIEVLRESGFPVELRSTVDAIEIELPTSLSAEALARFEERERTAAVAAVRSVLEPRSVAVIGASRRCGAPLVDLRRRADPGARLDAGQGRGVVRQRMGLLLPPRRSGRRVAVPVAQPA
jgi:GNAT superfamily N-acetyltransferase